MSPIDQNSKKHEGSHLRFSFGSRPERSTQQDPMEQEVRMTLPRPGELINGRYVVERKLGQGQFGWVYLVRHALLDQRFAMKIMNPRLANDDSWVTRFREEARLTSLLGHEQTARWLLDHGAEVDVKGSVSSVQPAGPGSPDAATHTSK